MIESTRDIMPCFNQLHHNYLMIIYTWLCICTNFVIALSLIFPNNLTCRLCLSRAYREASTRLALSDLSGALSTTMFYYYNTPPQTMGFCAHTSNIGLKATHRATVSWLQPTYVADVWIASAFDTSLDVGVSHITYVFLRSLFNMIYLRKLICFTSTVLVITSDINHNYYPNNMNACTTTQ